MSDRLALIIANSEFDDPKLTRLVTPGRDAEALAAVLHDPAIGDFNVTLRINESAQVVRREIEHLYQRRKKGDLLLLYYSGHGITDDYRDLYLAVKNTEVDYTSATAIDAAFVRRQLDKSGSQRKVVILDCCHSGAFVPGTKSAPLGLGSSAGAQEALAGSGYGRVILTASNAVEYAWEGGKLLGEGDAAAMSMFTHFLVQGLRTGAADLDGDGQISLDELYDYVHEQIVASGLARQTPQKSVHKVEGRIIIARNPHLVVKPAELPPELQQAIESRFAGVRAGAASELEHLLRGSDEGLALAARAVLERLADDDSRRVSAAAVRALDVSPIAVSPKPSPAPPPPVVAKPAPDVLTITLPFHLELVRVPAGEFLMGSDPAKDSGAYPGEQPQHPVHVSEFYMGRYPVTNEQYAAFVQATGHEAPGRWKGNKIPSGRENHPVVNVSWRDVRAFCEWLSQETGQSFRLPTEAEWEKAARGGLQIPNPKFQTPSEIENPQPGRAYPWGDEFDKARCNTSESGIDTTTPVGKYSPAGDSPYGCADMAGNVWEWTSSLYRDYPYQADDGREDPASSDLRVLRGGSFYLAQVFARCAYRYDVDPFVRLDLRGFRVGVAPFSPPSGRW